MLRGQDNDLRFEWLFAPGSGQTVSLDADEVERTCAELPNVGPFVLIEPEGLCDVGVTVLNNPLRFKAEPGRRFSQDTVQQV